MDVLDNAKASDGSKSEEIELEIAKYEEEGVKLKAEADRCEINASGFKKQIAEKDAVISEAQEKIQNLSEEKSDTTDPRRASPVPPNAAPMCWAFTAWKSRRTSAASVCCC